MMSIIVILLFSYPCMVLSALSFTRLPLPTRSMGPESIIFDSSGGGPYTGITDGRILKYQGPLRGFSDFAITVANRSKAECDGRNNPALFGEKCGRPVGLGINNSTGDIYIADAYKGLLVVRPNGGLATQLAIAADGVPFRFLDGLDVDPLTGHVYFTDASAVFQISQIPLAVIANDSTGRLLKYEPETKQVTVLLRNLSGAAGTAVSADGTFVLVTEFIGKRIQRYWLKGAKANTAETFATINGRPDNVKRTALGHFWVAANLDGLLPIVTSPTALRLDANGLVLEKVSLVPQYGITLISEVQQFGGNRYVGSMFTDFIGVYKH
ncbi:hypothetical protein LWI28_000722 [Acer negundo]|uniref:Strictosidine synthase conserved region domain-containing protein n=1 Tax=Acer negundo TaxID=4023 RepID=A0AAD5IPI7_ACENE|nr:hypothetical protein LWI28_000722 [Acer negundo]